MERWAGRVALVTGASMGIGSAVARRLVAERMCVVGVDRKLEPVQVLADELKGQPGSLIPIKCDLTKDDQVLSMFAQIKQKLGGVDVCINNAGIARLKPLLEGSPVDWREMMDINVIALCLCTREAVASMRERGIDDGHIILINSMAGHHVPPSSQLHYYSATKHAVTAITEGLRRELREAESNIKISAISPGVVKTEILQNSGMGKEAAQKFFEEEPCMTTDDIAATLVHVLAAPPHVQIHDVRIRPTQQHQ